MWNRRCKFSSDRKLSKSGGPYPGNPVERSSNLNLRYYSLAYELPYLSASRIITFIKSILALISLILKTKFSPNLEVIQMCYGFQGFRPARGPFSSILSQYFQLKSTFFFLFLLFPSFPP